MNKATSQRQIGRDRAENLAIHTTFEPTVKSVQRLSPAYPSHPYRTSPTILAASLYVLSSFSHFSRSALMVSSS